MRQYNLEPLVRGDSYPEWTLSADVNGIPVSMERVQLTVVDAAGGEVYVWDSEGDTPNVALTSGLATFAAIPDTVTDQFPIGNHNLQIRITYGGMAFTYFRGTWLVEQSLNA